MNRIKLLPLMVLVMCLAVPVFVLAKPPDTSGVPDDFLGDLYGDLYVILRDVNGVPMLDDVYGCVQPTRVEDVGGVLTLVVNSLYTNEEEEIYCELTEDMVDWVQEVEFGRLNLGRSPEPVLNHAFDEAINTMNAATDIQLGPAGRFMLEIDGAWKTIDSPLENLALYIKIMKEGHLITLDTDSGGKGRGGKGGPPAGKGPPEGDGPTVEDRPVLSGEAIGFLSAIGYGGLGTVDGVLDNEELLLAASFLAAAADKSGSITVDKVVYANSIYEINQLGTLPGVVDGEKFFDFSEFTYSKPYDSRPSVEFGCSAGEVWVLQPMDTGLWEAKCVSITGSVGFPMVKFTTVSGGPGPGVWEEGGENIAGFVQAANDALRVIEFVHNYSVPEVLE